MHSTKCRELGVSAYRIRGHTVCGLGYHAICQSSKKLSFRIRALGIFSNKETHKYSPEVVFPRLREVVLEAHGGLSISTPLAFVLSQRLDTENHTAGPPTFCAVFQSPNSVAILNHLNCISNSCGLAFAAFSHTACAVAACSSTPSSVFCNSSRALISVTGGFARQSSRASAIPRL